MRDIPIIKAAITKKGEELRALYTELDEALAARHADIVRRWDLGETFAGIGKAVHLPSYTIKNILWREGRTSAGRHALMSYRESLKPRVVSP